MEKYEHAPEAIKVFKAVLLAELKKRFFNKLPDDCALMCIMLNPQIKPEKHLSDPELEAAQAVFKRHYDRVADMLEAKMGTGDGPSLGTSPSPVRAEQQSDKRARMNRSIGDELEDEMADDGDDGDGDDGAEQPSISRAVERERFLNIGKADMKLAQDTSGRFDVLKLYALRKLEFPIHFVLALCFFGALSSEANVERVFSYTGGVMSAKRASLSAAMLQAMVFVSQNAAHFPFTTEELYEKYYDMFSKSFAIDAPEETLDNNDEDSD